MKTAQEVLQEADAILITAGNLFAKNEGLDILDQGHFARDYPDLAKNMHVTSIAEALDLSDISWESKWEIWSQFIYRFSTNYEPSLAMSKLRQLVDNKSYFIATSSFGHFFEQAGFDTQRIFNVFGDWTRMQCSSGINHGQVDDQQVVAEMIKAKQVSDQLVPKCSVCHLPMELHLPLNSTFFPDSEANSRLRWFLTNHEEQRLVVLEMGLDPTSPQLAAPIVSLAQQFPNWQYVAINGDEHLLATLGKRAFNLQADIQTALTKLVGE